jgi:hypothetical protein
MNNPKEFAPGLSVNSKVAACVSQGIKIKGELTGSEDLFVDGQVEGSITLTNSVVTVGPNASVKAEISAREVVVRGRVQGRITGTDSRRHEIGAHRRGGRRRVARHAGSWKGGQQWSRCGQERPIEEGRGSQDEGFRQ